MDGEERTKFGRVRVKNLVLLTVTCCVFLFFCVPVVGKGIIKNGDGHYC